VELMSKRQFIVIGLGRFGSSVAETLYSLGNDVLAIDYDEDVVQNISDKVTHAVQVDANDENSLLDFPFRGIEHHIPFPGSLLLVQVNSVLLEVSLFLGELKFDL